MTTQALYNKWRAQAFGEILGQDHITRTLRNQIGAGRIGHAYLFTGMRGTGKTSTARIMAKAVNCIGETDAPPCNRCHICRSLTEGRSLDLIEIDGASHRGIDEIRDLRDRVNFSPSECRYKVYVIDEVHMLTNEAFNALLKTLEEPPAHVIFILCTTAPQRLPDTILSRCQRFDFRRGSVAVVMEKLSHICDQEGIAIAPDALEFVARRAAGSFRDGESLLDQLATYGSSEITLDLVQGLLGAVSSALVAQLVEALVVGDVSAGLRAINQAIDDGAEPRYFLSEILDHLRALLLLKVGGEDNLGHLAPEALSAMAQLVEAHPVPLKRVMRAIRLFNDAGQGLRTAPRPQLPLEMAFIEAAMQAEATTAPPADAEVRPAFQRRVAVEPKPRGQRQGAAPPEPVGARGEATIPPAVATEAEAQVSSVEVKDSVEQLVPDQSLEEAAPTVEDADETGESAPPQALTLDWVRGHWNRMLMKIKPKSSQVQALLNSAYPVSVEGDLITVGCEADFHRDKLSEVKKRGLVERELSGVLGVPCRIEYIVHQGAKEAQRRDAQLSQSSTDFTSAEESPQAQRDKLLDHPTVKALEKLGGRVVNVSLYDQEQREDDRG